jgi:hypothetical protein
MAHRHVIGRPCWFTGIARRGGSERQHHSQRLHRSRLGRGGGGGLIPQHRYFDLVWPEGRVNRMARGGGTRRSGGPTGPAGAPGTSDTIWRGTWDSSTTYAIKDVVVRLGSQYVSKTSNTNKPPESNSSDWDLSLSKGDTGATGGTGSPGTDGKTILSGTTAPGSGLGTNGDFYLNTTTADLHGPKASGSWPAPVSLKGPQGNAGKTILSGSSAPSSGTGTDGDFYLNTAASTLYGPKASGAWPAGVTLIGPAGANGTNGIDGRTILSVTTAPSSGLGANGDFYLNTASSVLYGPKAGGIWPAGVALVGSRCPWNQRC